MADEREPQRTAAPSAGRAAAGAATAAGHGMRRAGGAWQALDGEYRLAAVAAFGLFLSMLLPWYEQTTTGVARNQPLTSTTTLSAFQSFSWVEAAVLLVAVGVLVLCFTRGERRSFHLPGGDGTVILAGSVWVCLLIFVRQLDKPEPDRAVGVSTTIGVQWGIFVAFVFGLLLAWAGWRLRAAHRPEPGPLDEAAATGHAPAAAATTVMAPDREPTRVAADPSAFAPDGRPRRRVTPAPDAGEQLRLDE